MNNTITPYYFLAPGNPVIAKYRKVFESFNEPQNHTMVLNACRKMVEAKDVVMVQQIVLALQHYPHLIHKFLFCLEFTFTVVEDGDEYISEQHWKNRPAYYQWFRKCMELPFMLFFIHDEDARFYSLIGDVLASKDVRHVQNGKAGYERFKLSDEQMQLLQDRLFHSCLALLVFCQGSGFNPGIYVQGILASFDAVFTYEDVLSEYAKDVLKGSFRVSTAFE
ncbi:MAG: hypothetical protein JWQ40_1965 [Segetibacter sp.]|nr:hypothetical protein [Segetibacter sp.]